MSPSFMYQAAGQAIKAESLLLYQDFGLGPRHRRLLREAVGRKRARRAWRLLGQAQPLVYVGLFDNVIPEVDLVTVNLDPSGIIRIAP